MKINKIKLILFSETDKTLINNLALSCYFGHQFKMDINRLEAACVIAGFMRVRWSWKRIFTRQFASHIRCLKGTTCIKNGKVAEGCKENGSESQGHF